MKETEIEKQLKEEQKILESIAEKKGNAKFFVKRNYLSIYVHIMHDDSFSTVQ